MTVVKACETLPAARVDLGARTIAGQRTPPSVHHPAQEFSIDPFQGESLIAPLYMREGAVAACAHRGPIQVNCELSQW